MPSIDVEELYEKLLQIYEDKYTNPRHVLYYQISELVRQGRTREEAIIALYQEEGKLTPAQVARAQRELVRKKKLEKRTYVREPSESFREEGLRAVIGELRRAAKRIVTTKTTRIARMEREKESYKGTSDTFVIIWVIFCLVVVAPLIMFSGSPGAGKEALLGNLGLVILVMILGSAFAYMLGFTIQERNQSRIDMRLRQVKMDLKIFQKKIEYDLNLFGRQLEEGSKQRKAKLEEIRKAREEHEREETLKKHILGYLLAYKSAKTPDLAKRFKLTIKQTKKMLSELQNNSQS